MAHFTKYKRGSTYHTIAHDRRDEKYGKENVDRSRTHLNYNLCDVKDEMGRIEELLKMAKDSGATIRKDTNVICSLIVTLPKDFPDNEELRRQFFIGCYDFACNDYGKENIISAWVHRDETTDHIHIKFCPIIEKIKKYKSGKEKTVFSFDAKNLISLSYLKTFHKRLEENLTEYIGFKPSILNGATKDGHKEVEELKEISEQQKKNRDIIDKDSDLILAEQKMICDECWKRYQEETRQYWKMVSPCRNNIKQLIWELKKGDKTAERQLQKDLDFFGNLANGLIFALIRLLSAVFVYTRKRTIEKQLNELEGIFKDIEGIRRTYSNQQHNVKEILLDKDIEKFMDAIKRLEETGTKAHDLIREVLERQPELELDKHIEKEYER